MFLAPNGQLFNAGPSPEGRFLNPHTVDGSGTRVGSWGGIHRTQLNAIRAAGSAVMYAPGKVLILGGGVFNGVTKTTEQIDLTAPTPQFAYVAPMFFARTHLNATLLPDGSVLATGGANAPGTSDADAVLAAELWTPPTAAAPQGTWRIMADMSVPRLYHSTALLLPDATGLTMGGGQAGYTEHRDYQIFTPPYLCRGLPRPQISSAPQAVAYGQSFVVSSPEASDVVNGGRVTLVRLPSVTHSFDMNQRFLELTPTATSPGTDLTLTVPSNANVCPPGHYMLFLLDSHGTPSHASIISINTTACASAITLSQKSSGSPQNPCETMARFTVSGGNPGDTYVWTVDGTSLGPAFSQTSIDVPMDLSRRTVQVTVKVNGSSGCGASTTFTSYFPGCIEG